MKVILQIKTPRYDKNGKYQIRERYEISSIQKSKANIYYWSCPLILDKMIENKEDTSKIIKWMKKGFLTIQENLKKPILNRRSHNQIIENLMSFIDNKMEDSDRKREKRITIGEQKDVFLMKETLRYYQFASLWNSIQL